MARLLRLHETDPDTSAQRRLAILALDTYAIARYARRAGTGATACDTALHSGSGPAPIWGGGSRDAAGAAFLNGSAAEALDFQEVLIDGRNNGHAAVVIVPALLALAAERTVPPDRVMAALRTAFVANVILARALGRGHRREIPGFRTTALVAPIAGALAGAVLCDANEKQTNHAVAIAASTLPAGLLAAMSPLSGDFSVDKDISVGFSARHVVDCARLALAGATGPADALTGPRGWLASYGFGDGRPDALSDAPSEDVLGAYALKLYPANFGCQCAIRLALEVAEQVQHDQIKAVDVRVKASSAASLSARTLTSHVAARFSLAYSVASALVRGRSVLADFEDRALGDPHVLAMMERITITGDDALEGRHLTEGIFPAELIVTRSDGHQTRQSLDTPQAGMDPAALDVAFAHKIQSLCGEGEAQALLGLLQDARYEAILTALTTKTDTEIQREEPA